ncbi:LuxR C-terminal-related transcriptional regulator [Kitasatospora sp. NPDC049285]|uniref:LuxR C-terminal-related transcriptional regulator n=1 Tax=Kitasatospora sp. NPDC049285 TaxID=3157096 RepID=UPI003443A479
MTTPSTAEPEPTTGPSPRAHEDAALLLRRLAPREAQVLARLVAGDDARAMAAHLGIAPATARAHLNRAMRKLGVQTREEAIALAAALAPADTPSPAEPAEPDRPAEPAESAAPAHARHPDPVHPDPVHPDPGHAHATVNAADAPSEPAVVADFADFCARVHTRLVQQTFLLTGSRHRAVHCAHLALGAAARRWAEVGTLPDPEAWVRGESFELTLSPWHRGGPRRAHLRGWPHRRIRVGGEPAGPEPESGLTHRDRALLKALRRLPRPQRRALVLHDTLGLPVERVAVEVESSTAAAAGRVRAARAALAAAVPELVGADPDDPAFGERLGGLLHRAATRACPQPRLPSPSVLVTDSRLHTGVATGAAALLTTTVGAAIATTLFGVGPSALVRPEPPVPTACTSAVTGSAGPALGNAAPGLQTPWCSPVPGVPAVLVDPPGGPALPAAPGADAPSGGTGAAG